jgi:ABC-type proline/glycine betaine transport system permease subunit
LKKSIQKISKNLKKSIQKISKNLKKSIQKISKNLKKSIQKVSKKIDQKLDRKSKLIIKLFNIYLRNIINDNKFLQPQITETFNFLDFCVAHFFLIAKNKG